MSSLKKRIDRIKQTVEIDELLFDYGYKIHHGGGHREQQFCCDLHGDGRDNKPSARMYPETGSWYCFACSKSRDAIETVRAKEGLGLVQAISFLEKKYNLPFLASDDDEDERYKTPLDSVASRLDTSRSYGDDLKRLTALLETATEMRSVSMDTLLAYWEALDKLKYQVAERGTGERPAQALLVRIYDMLLQIMQNGYAGVPE